VILIAHFVYPDVRFADRGKETLALPPLVGCALIDMVKEVCKDWRRQREAEYRSETAARRRHERLLKAERRSEKPEPATPIGVLAHTLHAAADKLGVSFKELLVQSHDTDPYAAYRHRRKAEWFARHWNRLVPSGQKKHLRGLFYLLVTSPESVACPAGKRFVNDMKHWILVQKAAKAARWLGFIAFDAVKDERNAPPEIYVPGVTPLEVTVASGEGCEVPADAKDALPRLDLHGFQGRQTHRIIFYGEKSSLATVLRPTAEQVGAEMILVTGDASDTHIAGSARRASEDGRPAVLFYFSDFDPAGHQMPREVARKLQAQRDLNFPNLDIKLYHVALTVEQVRELNLPSSPLKASERRASRWRATFGHEQTEIDALVELHPDVLRRAVLDAIAPFYDSGLHRRVHDAEIEWLETVRKASEEHPEYAQASERIEAAWGSATRAAVELRDAQEKLAAILRTSIPEPPEVPKAQPEVVAPPPLFDSTADFVTASKRLINHKALAPTPDEPAGEEDEP
jgi:hypothetical protein